MSTLKPHLPIYTKHRKGKGQFKRKKNHWADIIPSIPPIKIQKSENSRKVIHKQK
tara:strand:+ start:206 stop:370 length:165 start_codon:yes stop_codon:yes gene_type:complete